MNRLSGGATPALARQLRAAGGPRAWFESQLAPGSIPDGYANGMRSWFPETRYESPLLWKRHKAGDYPLWEVAADLQSWTLLRRIHSNRQLQEVMTDFWSNLLHIPAGDDKSYTWRWDYDATLRRHALGRFDAMLQAAITHPAMGCYLDNAQSSDVSLNENLGRELLELHTLGVGARYTEDDVKMSARILTGYNVDMWDTFEAWYAKYDHYVGPVRVLRFTDPNAHADGRPVVARYLRYLAHHPATARRIARRLCVRHRHQGDPARPGVAPGLPLLGRPEGAYPGRGRGRQLPSARRATDQAHPGRRVRQGLPLAGLRHGPAALRLATTRRGSGPRRVVERCQPGAALLRGAPHRRRRRRSTR
jgi:hypothetical protein